MPDPPHVLQLQMPRIFELDMGLGDAADQQHDRARPVKVTEQFHALVAFEVGPGLLIRTRAAPRAQPPAAQGPTPATRSTAMWVM